MGRRKKKSAPSTASGTSSNRAWLLALVAAALGGIVYLNTLDHPFVYDDERTVVENASLRDPNLIALLAWERFRPLINLTYALDFQLGELEPQGYHLTSIFLHMLHVALLFLFARTAFDDSARRTASPPGASSTHFAFAVAALFAVHPMMSEAVGYVSGRSEVLCGVFLIPALLAHRRWILSGRIAWLAAALGCFVLSAGSKEVGGMWPFLALLQDQLLVTPPDEDREAVRAARRRRLLCLHLPLIALVIAGGVFRIRAFVRDEALLPRSIWQNVMTEWEIIWRYLRLLFLPTDQSLVHPTQRIGSFWDLGAWIAGLGLVALMVFAWRGRDRVPIAAFGVFWFLLLLAPSSSFVPLNELMAEHRVYAASSGFFLALIAFGELASRRVKARGSIAVALAVLLGVLSIATWQRNEVWRDPVTLWRDAATKAPLTWRAVVGWAQALRNEGDCEAAVPVYRRAIELQANDAGSRMNLGICHAMGKRYGEAEAYFLQALEVDPTLERAHNNLGRLAELRGDAGRARAHYLQAIEIDPENVKARMNLIGLARRHGGDLEQVLGWCRDVSRLAPETPGMRECVEQLEKRLGGG